MTSTPTSGGTPLPDSAFTIQSLSTANTANELADNLGLDPVSLADPLVANGTTSCSGSTCTLDAPRTIVDNASANTIGLPVGGTDVSLLGGLFAWQYALDVPDDQPAGTYNGGQVTFTATN
jgi:hypothetical protein